jgi:DNA-binding response OmpR family regulator
MAAKVLVVDDEPHIVALVQNRLKAVGYEVLSAFDGEEGVKKAKESSPDLIILDVLMPKLSGIEVAIQLRADEKTKKIPIIMLTAILNKDEEERHVTFTDSICLAKPIDPEELMSRVRELTSGK